MNNAYGHEKTSSYCAFLRGVNVGGIAIKMKDVCTLFEELGLKSVSSVLASGNILFTSDRARIELKLTLEKALSLRFAYEAFIFLVNQEEIEDIISSNPFAIDTNFHNYIFIGVDGIEHVLMREFENSQRAPDEEAQIVNNNFYWRIRKGNTIDSEFGKVLAKKKLKDSFTSRNINTLERVLRKMS